LSRCSAKQYQRSRTDIQSPAKADAPMHCSTLQHSATIVLQHTAAHKAKVRGHLLDCESTLQCVAVCCNAFVCCSVCSVCSVFVSYNTLTCAAVCSAVLPRCWVLVVAAGLGVGTCNRHAHLRYCWLLKTPLTLSKVVARLFKIYRTVAICTQKPAKYSS